MQAGKKFRGKGSKLKNDAAKEALPELTGFVDRIREDLDASWRVTEHWRIRAEECYGYVENNQWKDRDRSWIQTNDPTRPIMTFNDILPIIRVLSGIERQKGESFRVKPREGGDVDSARILTELIQYVDDENLGFYQRVRKSNDVNITGRGYIKTDISYDENVNGDIILKRRNPLTIFNDPMADEWDGTDRKWCAEGEWITEEEAKELWPDFADQIHIGDWLSSATGGMPGHLTGDKHQNNKLYLDNASKRVRIFDYWYRKIEPVMLAVNMDTGDAKPIQEPEEFFEKFAQMDGETRNAIKIIKRKVTTIRIATIMNWLLLRDDPSPFSHRYFPITPYVGLQFYNEPNGLVHYLTDPQDLLNKGISQSLNHLNRSANSGWMNHATQGANPDVLKRFGSVPGVVINHNGEKPEQIRPSPISAGHFTLTQFAKDQIKGTSLVNAEIQGQSEGSRTISGKAIQARQQGGLVGNEDLFDNGLLGDKIVGIQLISLIQDNYTPTRAKRIVENISLGTQATPLAEILLTKKDRLPEMIDMALKEEYDYIIDRSGGGLSAMERLAVDLKDLAVEWAKTGTPVPVSLITATIKAQPNIPGPDKDAIIAEIKMMKAQQMAMAGMGGNGAGPGSRRYAYLNVMEDL